MFLLEGAVSFETGQTGSGSVHRFYSPFPASLGNCPWLRVGIICFFSSFFLRTFLEAICISSLITLEQYVISVLGAPGAEWAP